MCGGGATRVETPEDQRTLGAYIEPMGDNVLERVVAIIQVRNHFIPHAILITAKNKKH